MFFLLLVLVVMGYTKNTVATVYLKNSKYVVEEGVYDKTNGLCFGSFDDSYYERGWDFLYLNTTQDFEKYDDSQISYCAGFLEGYLTRERIYMYFQSMAALSFIQFNGSMPQFARDFLTEQKDYVNSQSKNDDFWNAAQTTYDQLYGMVDGYNYEQQNETKKLSFWDIYLLYSLGDMMDILKLDHSENLGFFTNEFDILTGQPKKTHSSTISPHCSAFISRQEVSDGDEYEVYFAHTTWALYSMMVRIFKTIHIHFSNPLMKSDGVYFSSSPGAVGSNDDFYITSSDLFVQETTLTCFNDSLSQLITPKSLLYWQRTLLANRLSSTPKEWADYFSRENSGTYNNEWMVIDAASTGSEGSFYVVDQIPGTVEKFDLTDHLLTENYFGSYNLPYSKNVYNICEIPEQLKLHPDQNSSLDYEHCARANIFREFLSNNDVRDGENDMMDNMRNLIRYNNYQNDPLTLGDPSLTIASRTDLEKKNAFCSGAIDGKIVSTKEWMEWKKLWIISGPSTDQVPVFKYSDAGMICSAIPFIKHVGQPDVWDFPWIGVKID